jgi:site-specific DNA-cytosine methylase
MTPDRPLRVLVACEYSGRVRQAFRDRGHDAWSCDLLPAEDNSGYHVQRDVLTLLKEWRQWDVMIAHPPCTRLTNAGARWWKGQEAEQAEALEFVRKLMAAPIPGICIENPPGKIGTAIRKADQYIQPWQYGHPETKRTGLWLKGLPLLKPTRDVHAHMMTLSLAERSRVHWMAQSPDRWKERSRTYEGIAEAMAEQWGGDALRVAA